MLTACPECGCETYYRKVRFSGSGQYNYRFDGELADNTHLHDPLNYNEQASMFCEECHTLVGRVKKEGAQ